MRCSRCGTQIGNSFVRINGVLLCENCARELRVDDVIRRQNAFFEQAFPSLGEIPGVFAQGSELDFANAKIRCPRCGTTLKDVESGGQLGCIECYNTFNESIMKHILKRQGSSEYLGRKPAEQTDIVTDTEVKEPSKKEKTDLLEKLRKADLGTVPDDMLEEGMQKAVKAEDYELAATLRDELKSRKGGNE